MFESNNAESVRLALSEVSKVVNDKTVSLYLFSESVTKR
jgi:hypothetical protein